MTKIKIRTWIIHEKFELGEIPWVLDYTNLDVSTDELSLCIQEQIFGDMLEDENSSTSTCSLMGKPRKEDLK